jgi:hypothetical protein
MVGEINAKIVLTDIKDTFGRKKPIDTNALEMAMVLAC